MHTQLDEGCRHPHINTVVQEQTDYIDAVLGLVDNGR
jgi:hypothetical protein